MSFTTRCPACGTTFRIVADQLKISEGWVRCGHCADVFDATLYLEPWVADPLTPAAAAPEPPDMVESADRSGDTVDPISQAPVAVLPVLEAQTATQLGSKEVDFGTELQRFAEARAATATTAGTEASAAPSATARDAPQDSSEPAGPPPASAPPEPPSVPGFVRQAQRRAFWQSRSVRAGLALLALLLCTLLLAQVAYDQRDRLAAAHPELLPLMQTVCARIGCTVEPVRNIDAIVIDSSALVRRLGNFHSFDLVLKNTANTALALPALELSLTNSRDEVISRRVFLPEQWPDAPTVIPAKSSLNVSFRLALTVDDSTPMAGYRALVFYP